VEFGPGQSVQRYSWKAWVHLNNTVPKRQDLAERLRTAGCAVNTIGAVCHEAGDLTSPVAPGGGLPLGRKLRKSQSSPVPRLGGRYIDNGSPRLSAVETTNHGPGDVYELDLEDAERDGIMLQEIELLVPRLPAGKGVRVFRNGIDSIWSGQQRLFHHRGRPRRRRGRRPVPLHRRTPSTQRSLQPCNL
jgi:hypothetical protein